VNLARKRFDIRDIAVSLHFDRPLGCVGNHQVGLEILLGKQLEQSDSKNHARCPRKTDNHSLSIHRFSPDRSRTVPDRRMTLVVYLKIRWWRAIKP
jgi:hypothetical protein